MKCSSFFFLIAGSVSCLLTFESGCREKKPSKEIEVFKNDSITKGFGYNILMNGKVIVHQPTVPAVRGNSGFSSEEDAGKTAELVLYKIKHNMMPPSVEIRELDSIGVLK
jgi:hypothetical protein